MCMKMRSYQWVFYLKVFKNEYFWIEKSIKNGHIHDYVITNGRPIQKYPQINTLNRNEYEKIDYSKNMRKWIILNRKEDKNSF